MLQRPLVPLDFLLEIPAFRDPFLASQSSKLPSKGPTSARSYQHPSQLDDRCRRRSSSGGGSLHFDSTSKCAVSLASFNGLVDLLTPEGLTPRPDRVEYWPTVSVNDYHRSRIIAQDLETGENLGGRRGNAVGYDAELSMATLFRDDAPPQQVGVAWRPCRLGGSRPLFVCPECEKRRINLHCVDGVWRCRTCSGLRYDCQRLGRGDRKLLRAARLRQSVGQTDAFIFDPVPRPKHMKWSRYFALDGKIIELEKEALRETEARIEAWATGAQRALQELAARDATRRPAP